MRVITVIQPWATLIALGEKQFETRSWATKDDGPLAIHAGKKIDREACLSEPIRSTLAKHGYTAENLPTGVILARCYLYDCHKITHVSNYSAASISDDGEIMAGFEGNELAFGFYSQGRFAWELRNVTQIDPIPAKGQQRFWYYDGLAM